MDLGYTHVTELVYFCYIALRNGIVRTPGVTTYPDLVYTRKDLWEDGYAPYIKISKRIQPRQKTATLEIEVYAPDGKEEWIEKLVKDAIPKSRILFDSDPDRDYVRYYVTSPLPEASIKKYILRLFIVLRRETGMRFEKRDRNLKSMICDTCETDAPATVRCKGCGDAYYCGQPCALDAWTRGQHECDAKN